MAKETVDKKKVEETKKKSSVVKKKPKTKKDAESRKKAIEEKKKAARRFKFNLIKKKIVKKRMNVNGKKKVQKKEKKTAEKTKDKKKIKTKDIKKEKTEDKKKAKVKTTKKTDVKKTIKKKKTKRSDAQKTLKKIRTSIRFRRPKTLKLPPNPHCPRIERSCHTKKLDKYGIIKYPVTSEKAMKRIEEMNTLVFICDRRAHKPQIKKALKELYDIDCAKINTLNCFAGEKKAYVRLNKDQDALNVANKIGIL